MSPTAQGPVSTAGNGLPHTQHTPAGRQRIMTSRGPATPLLVGGLCGLAWAAGLRGMMAAIAGSNSHVDWALTFGRLLLPGMIVGVLLGWAEHWRRTGLTRARRWFVLSPLVFAAVLFAQPTDLIGLFEDVGGDLAVPLLGMAGGYALAGRGPTWTRLLAALVALLPIPAWALAATQVGGPGLAFDTPRGAWIAVYLYSYLALLAIACTIPHRLAAPHVKDR